MTEPSRRNLRIGDWSLLAEALRAADQPSSICRMLETISGKTIGHRLFTVMRLHNGSEVERIHTSLPSVYPIGGRKKKSDTAWADHVLRDGRVFRGNNAADIRFAFDDHEKILGLGLGSVLNIPIVYAGRCLGTMNLLHQTGWYGPDDERLGQALAAFLVPVLLAGPS